MAKRQVWCIPAASGFAKPQAVTKVEGYKV